MNSRIKLSLYAFSIPAFCLSTVCANPLGGVVGSGVASITPGGNLLTISQASDRAIINWNSFNIANGETTLFQFNGAAGASSAVLNRVNIGNPSIIAGMLQSTIGVGGPRGGTVMVLNPSGILFTPSSTVNVGSLVASTLNLAHDDEFLNNATLHFSGASTAGIQNHGSLSAVGDIFLIAHTVQNSGNITAGDHAGLAAGTSVSLAQTGRERLTVLASSSTTTEADGVENTVAGQINATTAELKAAGGNIYALAINNGGVIRANTVTHEGGHIYLRASGGTVVNSGTLDASGTAAGVKGGEVQLTGEEVRVAAGSIVDASGNAGGGTVLIGGDLHGANPEVPNANHTVVEDGATIRADSLGSGNAGKVVVWSDGTTEFGGTISARSFGSRGAGGLAEISGRDHLALWGHAYLGGANGARGNLLLDPGSVLIDSGPNTAPPGTLDTFHDGWVVNQLNTGGADLTISTAAANNLNPEILTVDALANVSWNSGNSLTLVGNAGVTINGVIGNSGLGGLTVSSAAGGIAVNNTLTFSGGGNVNLSAFGTLGLNSSIVAQSLIASGASITLNSAGVTASPTVKTTGGGQTYNGPVALSAGTVLEDTTGGAIAFSSTVDGAQALEVNTAGTTSFGGAVGGTTPLTSLTTDNPAAAAGSIGGSTAVNGGSVATSGAQTYNDDVTLGADTVLNGSAVTLAKTVNGAAALTVNAAGATTFGGAVGGTTPLNSLTTDAAGSTAVNGGSVATSGAQTYNDDVTLGADTVLNGSAVTLAKTVNG
ncbi:MAG: trimeric autotransporter adhesin, partial [Verrucomicrobiota bacterium]